MKVMVAINNRRGNLNVGTFKVEASSTIEGLREVLGREEVKQAFKQHGYVTGVAWAGGYEEEVNAEAAQSEGGVS